MNGALRGEGCEAHHPHLSRCVHQRNSQWRADHHRCGYVDHRLHRPGLAWAHRWGNDDQQLRGFRAHVRRAVARQHHELCRAGFLPPTAVARRSSHRFRISPGTEPCSTRCCMRQRMRMMRASTMIPTNRTGRISNTNPLTNADSYSSCARDTALGRGDFGLAG
jgi:hypothetical protein